MAERLEIPEAVWQRVSPKYIVAEYIGAVIGAAVFLVAAWVFTFTGWPVATWALIAVAVLSAITLVLIPRQVKAIGYQLREDDLLFRRGILFQRFVAVPYGRMQLVDINRGPLLRALGLSELKFVTAAASTGITIPGLPEVNADDLRDRLVALAETRRAGL
ncbi:PH domain-containing protein [Leifsonia bigeumensis]|uniref:PH domain-containing protein n=1 Tax=Leifsonella bigeumensis TaxID=433643 RepID=A0ABP7F067_9MICO